MDTITNAFLAPFSSEKAAKTTPAKTALAYGVAGILVGVLFLNKA